MDLRILQISFQQMIVLQLLSMQVVLVLFLNSTPGSDKQKIKSAIDKLGAGGSTAGAKEIITAYEIA